MKRVIGLRRALRLAGLVAVVTLGGCRACWDVGGCRRDCLNWHEAAAIAGLAVALDCMD